MELSYDRRTGAIAVEVKFSKPLSSLRNELESLPGGRGKALIRLLVRFFSGTIGDSSTWFDSFKASL